MSQMIAIKKKKTEIFRKYLEEANAILREGITSQNRLEFYRLCFILANMLEERESRVPISAIFIHSMLRKSKSENVDSLLELINKETAKLKKNSFL